MTLHTSYALITGASSGIGKDIAIQLAKHGYNIIAVARNTVALAELKTHIESSTKSSVDTIECNLIDSNALNSLIEKLKQKPVSVLVNNAGFGIHGEFANTPIHQEEDLVFLQINCMLRLTKVLIPELRKHREAFILNVGSVYSFIPTPRQSVYSASKAFLKSFSDALRAELYGTSIKVCLTCPGITFTNFRSRSGMKDKKAFGMSSEQVAKITLKHMFKGKSTVIPGGIYRLFVAITSVLPTSVVLQIITKINKLRGLQSH